MDKHAYLIMAYRNWEQLKLLVSLLDDEHHDIFIHIDKKSGGCSEAEFAACTRFSKVSFVDPVEVYWADYSQVEATMRLLKAAEGAYSYYHLLSGEDLPIKSNHERYVFFQNSGREFIGIVPNEVYYSVRRVRFYHPFTHFALYRRSKVLKGLDRLLEYVQALLGINRLRNYTGKIIDGWQWFSITDKFCSYILQREEQIQKMFQRSIASDELVFQTMAYNSEFYEKLYCTSDLKKGSMRLIDWKRGAPYVWRSADYDEIMQSPYMFARKFDPNVDQEIIDKIAGEIVRRNEDDKRTAGLENQKTRY